MSLIASDNGGVSIPKLEGGVYNAISSAIIDLGVQKSEKFGNEQRKFIMVWTILGEEVEVNGEKLPRQISKEYSFSLNEKSTLRKDLQAWRNKVFTEEELKGFNILNVLNVPCQLQILLEEKNGKQYNNIASIMGLPKGTTIEKLTDTFYFDTETKESWSNWKRISKWIQDRIKKAKGYTGSELNNFVAIEEASQNNTQRLDTDNNYYSSSTDDLPF